MTENCTVTASQQNLRQAAPATEDTSPAFEKSKTHHAPVRCSLSAAIACTPNFFHWGKQYTRGIHINSMKNVQCSYVQGRASNLVMVLQEGMPATCSQSSRNNTTDYHTSAEHAMNHIQKHARSIFFSFTKCQQLFTHLLQPHCVHLNLAGHPYAWATRFAAFLGGLE